MFLEKSLKGSWRLDRRRGHFTHMCDGCEHDIYRHMQSSSVFSRISNTFGYLTTFVASRPRSTYITVTNSKASLQFLACNTSWIYTARQVQIQLLSASPSQCCYFTSQNEMLAVCCSSWPWYSSDPVVISSCDGDDNDDDADDVGGDVAQSELSARWRVPHWLVAGRQLPLSSISAQDADTRHQNGSQRRGSQTFFKSFISVCLSVTLAIHAWTLQYIEILL